MLHAAGPATSRLELALLPPTLVSGWRPADRILSVPVSQPLPAVLRWIQLRITLVGLGAAATTTGRVLGVQKVRGASVLRIEPDAPRRKALERLVAIAAGSAPAACSPRDPRVLATLPAVVLTPSGPTYMCTMDVSATGCRIAWSGAAPTPGAETGIQLGAGRSGATVAAQVRWVETAGRTAIVGVQLIGGDREAWARMHTNLKRSGALPA